MTTNFENKTLFPWPTVVGGWHKPGNPISNMIDAQAMRLQHLAEAVQKAYSETYERQIDVVNETSERMTQGVQDVMSSQGAVDLLSAESRLANVWLEGVAARSHHWLSLSQKLQECCTDFVRASFDDLRKQNEDLSVDIQETAAETTGEAGKQLKAVKAGTKHAA
jgi:exonuclease VII large subunit